MTELWRHLLLGHVTGSGGATFQTDPKKLERSCGPKCCVKDRSIKSGSIQGATTIATRPWSFREQQRNSVHEVSALTPRSRGTVFRNTCDHSASPKDSFGVDWKSTSSIAGRQPVRTLCWTVYWGELKLTELTVIITNMTNLLIVVDDELYWCVVKLAVFLPTKRFLQ